MMMMAGRLNSTTQAPIILDTIDTMRCAAQCNRFDPDEPPRSYLQSREESMLGEGSVAASPGTMLGRHLGRLNFPSHHQKGYVHADFMCFVSLLSS